MSHTLIIKLDVHNCSIFNTTHCQFVAFNNYKIYFIFNIKLNDLHNARYIEKI